MLPRSDFATGCGNITTGTPFSVSWGLAESAGRICRQSDKMKAILEFSLPEEEGEHQLALDGGKWQSACFDFDQWLRGIIKHTDRETISVQEVRDKLWDELKDRGLSYQ